MSALSLQANPIASRDLIARRQDTAFASVIQSVWESAHHQCHYCGVPMRQGQEVMNKDGCYTNNELSNLVATCPFCMQCCFLEIIEPSTYGGGVLIYLPEMTQASLNGLCYILFKAMHDESAEEKVAQQTYRRLTLRAQLVEHTIGSGMSDPAVFGQLLIESEIIPDQNSLIQHMRLLPLWGAFKSLIAHEVAYEMIGQ